MDILYATNTWCSTDHNRGRGNTDGPTIDDLISSMRSHFVDGPPLAGSGGPSEGSAAVDLGQRVHSSTRSTAKLGRSLAQFVREEQANTVPNPGWDVTNNMDTVGVQFEVKDALFGMKASGDTSSRQGSHQPSDGQFTSSDLPLSVCSIQSPLEEIEVDIAPDHPRLQSDFYQRLRDRYPRAFRRKTSISSDTTSICSDTAGSELPNTMTPMPRGHIHHQRNAADPTFQRDGGLPPRPPASVQRSGVISRGISENVSSKYLTTQDVASRLQQDLTITGTPSNRRTTKYDFQTASMMEEFSLHGNNRNENIGQIQGILKKDILQQEFSAARTRKGAPHSEAVLSLKDRLKQNKLSLKHLLSEENNPLRRRRQHVDMNQSFESDILESDDLPISHHSEHRTVQKYRMQDSNRMPVLPSQTLDTHILHHQISSECEVVQTQLISQPEIQQTSPRSLADQPKRKHLGTKRYISPDSAHDSAVDMDTASLQSSPGSSDTQTNGINVTSVRTKTGVRNNFNRLSPGGINGFINQVADEQITGVLSDHQVPLNKQAAFLGSQEFHFAVGSSSHNKDSDVDSGIAQPYHSGVPRERKDSSSSLENEQELEALSNLTRVHDGQRFASLSTQDLRAAHKTRNGGMRDGKYGPLRADHNIQPSSPQQQKSYQQRQNEDFIHQRLPVSPFDLNQKRASPVNRVRFEDEVSEGDSVLSQQHRALSHPDLSLGFEVRPQTPEGTTPGRRRAHKLKGGRNANGMSASVPFSQADLTRDSFSPDQTGHEHRTQGLPPSGRNGVTPEDGPRRAHKLRGRSRTPTEVIQAVASDAHTTVDSNMQVHRASPVVVLPPAGTPMKGLRLDDSQLYLSDTPSSDMDLHDEVAYFNGFSDAWNAALSAKKSKKPWKRNKGHYTPSNEVEKVQVDMIRKQIPPRRPHSSLGEGTGGARPPTGRWLGSAGVVQRPSSCTAEINTPSRSNQRTTSGRETNHYEEVRLEGASGVPSLENPYEEVQFHDEEPPESPHETGEDLYAVPQRKSRRDGGKRNPCIVNHSDESIHQEEAPPVPERGYTSDLEKYKDLSGSRSSLSGKMDSFRRAARSKWSALRRAVSLERVNNTESDDAPGNLKKSPSLQSLAKRLSFTRKDKGKSSAFGDVPVTPPSRNSQPKRPSSAPVGRSKNHSSSLTSLNMVDGPQNFRAIGKLKHLNPDGTQIIELVRPPHGPFGFYIARGNIKYGGGVFVSRLSDSLPGHFFTGLLGIGDEIQEINCQPIQNLTLDEVYAMMAERNHLLLKTLPYLARKDT